MPVLYWSPPACSRLNWHFTDTWLCSDNSPPHTARTHGAKHRAAQIHLPDPSGLLQKVCGATRSCWSHTVKRAGSQGACWTAATLMRACFGCGYIKGAGAMQRMSKWPGARGSAVNVAEVVQAAKRASGQQCAGHLPTAVAPCNL
jgi:hypothetical protein